MSGNNIDLSKFDFDKTLKNNLEKEDTATSKKLDDIYKKVIIPELIKMAQALNNQKIQYYDKVVMHRYNLTAHEKNGILARIGKTNNQLAKYVNFEIHPHRNIYESNTFSGYKCGSLIKADYLVFSYGRSSANNQTKL